MSTLASSRRRLIERVVLGVVVVGAWVVTYSTAASLTAEYGRGVFSPSALVVAVVVVAAVAAALARITASRSGSSRPTAVAWSAAAVAAVGVAAAALAGQATGAAAHAQRESSIEAACSDGADTATLEFARETGRVIPTNGEEAHTGADGCLVMVAIDKSRGDDPLAVIDDEVAEAGWQRDDEAAWVRSDGFRVTARVEPADADQDVAEHAVMLVGRRP